MRTLHAPVTCFSLTPMSRGGSGYVTTIQAETSESTTAPSAAAGCRAFEAAFEPLSHRLPRHADRLHREALDTAGIEPIPQAPGFPR